MKIAICDDEQVCIDRLCTHIDAYCTDRRLVCDCQTFTDPLVFEASDLASYDMVFLDANMGQMDGITAAKALRQVNKTAILVYISGFVEYAPLGYRVDAFRYLMKHELDSSFVECMDEMIERLDMNRKQLTIVTTGGEQKLTISSLVFLESFRHQILLHLADGVVLESKRYSLSELTELLAPHSFLRIHKSFLVNPEYIEVIKNRELVMKTGRVLACGKKDYSQILQSFMLWKGAR